MIDRHTRSLLRELSLIKSKHLNEIEIEMEEIDKYCTIFASFELTARGSANDICSSVDQIIVRADDLERDHEDFIGRQHKSLKVFFYATTEFGHVLLSANGNFVGHLESTIFALASKSFLISLR